ncbi:nucleotidyltransferase family protein [Nguyenibacter sp. L1]|uniref:nucleotidyltransferase family protein n=1 Tax=Nguyenibacter sp. L1 TaxID=3049350 RepID=UPI002B461DCB|nr:nucleotidyltransferase family protein [Nguyenibacter sp. L1]WRH89199.1 nucleotidyltransferase family protein [Nguyenibacter sp. L1]
MTTRPKSVAAILLAAGRSTRTGARHKLLASDRASVPMVVRTLRALCTSPAWPIIVVLGHRADDLRTVIAAHAPYEQDVTTCLAADHADGLSASLRAGVREAARHRPSGVLICLGDMPGLKPDLVARLIACHHEAAAPAIVPVHGGQHGHPALWDRAMIPELIALRGDQGARGLIRALGTRVRTLDADPSIHQDFDTAEQLDDFARS